MLRRSALALLAVALAGPAFAQAADTSRSQLVSLGRHRLRGVREETELFGLAS